MMLSIKNIFCFDFKNIFLLILYYFLLLNTYQYLYDNYEHIGFNLKIDRVNTIIAHISISLIIIFRFYLNKIKKSDYTTLDFILVLFTIPAIVFYYFNSDTPLFLLLSYLLLPLIFGITNYYLSQPKRTIIDIRFPKRFLIVITIICIIPIIFTYGVDVDYNIFSLGGNIYDVRLKSFSKSSRFLGYISSWLSNVILPISLVYYLNNKKYLYASTIFIILLYLFLIFAQKSNLLAIFLVLFFYIVNNKRTGYNYVFLSLILIICTTLITSDTLLSSLGLFLLYRILFVPIEITSFYFEFFQNNHTFLSHSIFNPFIDYGYTKYPSNIIGELYFNSNQVSANTGLIGDAFMNFGYVGIFLYATIFSFFILKLLDKIPNIYYGVLLIQIFSFQNSPLTTVLITHGFLFFLITLKFSKKLIKI